jgi:hypothetical protein
LRLLPADVGDAMQRFKAGDRVMLLAQYAHLYPGNNGIVTEVRIDTYREAFNEYKIEFTDGSTGDVFEFQIGEAVD